MPLFTNQYRTVPWFPRPQRVNAQALSLHAMQELPIESGSRRQRYRPRIAASRTVPCSQPLGEAHASFEPLTRADVTP